MTSGALVIVAVVGALIGGAIVAFVPLAVLVHEGGHAVAAWLVGFRVLRVELGRGRPWAVRRRAGVDLALAGWLVGGRVLVARDEEAGWRWRFAAAAPPRTADRPDRATAGSSCGCSAETPR